MADDITLAGIGLDTRPLERAVADSRRLLESLNTKAEENARHTKRSAESLGNLWRAAAGYVSVQAAAGAVMALGHAIMEAEKASARMEGVLKATGHAAGRTARDLEDMAGVLQRTTLFDDEEIQQGMAVLLTFRKVQTEVFDDAIALSTDLAAVFGQSLSGAATMLGKALESPVAGITALTRVGVTFSDAQKTQIAQLVEQNKLLEAQRMVLDGVRVQVEGTAKAMNTGLIGATTQLAGAWGNWLESLRDTDSVMGPVLRLMNEWTEMLNAVPKTTALKLEVRGIEVQEELDAVQKKLARSGTNMTWLNKLDTGASHFSALTGDQRAYLRLREEQQLIEMKISQEMLRQQDAREMATRSAKEAADAAAKEAAATTAAAAGVARGEALAKQREEAAKAAARQAAAVRDLAQAIEDENTGLRFGADFLELEQAARAGLSTEQLRQLLIVQELRAAKDAENAAIKESTKVVTHAAEATFHYVSVSEQAASAFQMAWQSAIENTEDRFAAFFEDFLLGRMSRTFRSFLSGMLEAAASMAAQSAAAGIVGAAMAPILSAAAWAGGGGFFGAGMHTGGMVGEDTPTFTRQLPASTWASAPRYHQGHLASDEVPAILQKGESVLTPGQLRAVAGAGGGGGNTYAPTVPVTIYAMDSRDVQRFLDDNRGLLAQAVLRGMNGSAGMRNAFARAG